MNTRFSNALRQAIYIVECPMQTLADGAKVGRSTIYEAMHGRHVLKPRAAKDLACAVCEQIHMQIEQRQREIENLRQRETELRGAYNSEYGGGKIGG